MQKVSLLALILLANSVIAQNRINKISANLVTNFYSYGDGQGHMNNVVRLREDLSISYKTYDTVKNSGMIYEVLVSNPTAYYKNILPGNSILEVNDLYANLNIIFPFLILHSKRIEHSFGAGIGIATLGSREYYDENNNQLPYNSTNLKEIKFGSYWHATGLLDYELNLKFSRKIGVNFGIRYTSDAPFHKGNSTYVFTQGTSVGFKFGMFYQFK
jgi:hypothetical protein